jgi:hypothetical protein
VQLEFSVLSLWLSLILIGTWFVTLYVFDRTPWTFGLVALGGPVLLTARLWMVRESYAAFAELVRGTIDLSRFDLLQARRRPLPTSPQQERAAWDEVTRLLRLNETNGDVNYTHPAA